ncbi:MAG: ABC transporter ATP-binding protein [Chitinispirillaceae bacterium]|nr:ABC transporter ATP-binding protein [Chitinispirillaceae bacterium]
MTEDPLLTIDKVSRNYRTAGGTVTALDTISLTVHRGEFAVIEGKSGSGKTTLLLCCGGLLHPDCGTVSLGSTDFYAASSQERTGLRAQKIGFVFQQFHLVPYLTVMENIMVPSMAVAHENPGRRALELLETLDLAHRSGHFPDQLSTGEKQRTALARAFFSNPELILADEPTGNLDSENAAIVLKYLKAFRERGGAVMLVTHDSSLFHTGDSRYHMVQGKLQ